MSNEFLNDLLDDSVPKNTYKWWNFQLGNDKDDNKLNYPYHASPNFNGLSLPDCVALD